MRIPYMETPSLYQYNILIFGILELLLNQMFFYLGTGNLP